MTEERWYAPGLHFTCTQCGNCCTGAPGCVWVDKSELEAIADYQGRTIGEIRLHHTRLVGQRTSLTEYANGDCTFFDPQTRTCTVYPVRPRQCRTWPFWRSNLASPEAWSEVQRVCPGARAGGFVPVAEIERQAAEIEL